MNFEDYPIGWADTVNKLRRKLIAPTLFTLTVLEESDWDIEIAERRLREDHGYGGRSE
jgi:hypothetical protein